MGIGSGVLSVIMNLRFKRVMFVNICFVISAVLLLSFFDSVNGRRRRFGFGPQMIVFNLDEVLWPYTFDTVTIVEPRRKVVKQRKEVVDDTGKVFNLFPEVPKIFDDLEKQFFNVSLISQSKDAGKVRNMLELFDIDKYFNHRKIYPGNKTQQLEKLSEESGVGLEDMLYFDSNPKDTKIVSSMNVTTTLIDKNGVTVKSVYEGLRTFNETHVERKKIESEYQRPFHGNSSYIHGGNATHTTTPSALA